MNRFKKILSEYNKRKNDLNADSVFWEYEKDVVDALKLAAKLEKGPSERMMKAGHDMYYMHVSEIFKAMYEQAKREIE